MADMEVKSDTIEIIHKTFEAYGVDYKYILNLRKETFDSIDYGKISWDWLNES